MRSTRIIAAVVAGLFIVLVGGFAPEVARANASERVVLAGGCFWGMEAVFDSLRGVSRAVPGYAGGSKADARYVIVSSGRTGHAESVEITYDPAKISFNQLLDVFFLVAHDPTEVNRQGPDTGTQYRSAIFYTTDEQKRAAAAYILRLERDKVYRDPVVTEVVPFAGFYPAEAEHQHFVARNPYYPYVVFNDKPKLERLRKQFPQLLKARS